VIDRVEYGASNGAYEVAVGGEYEGSLASVEGGATLGFVECLGGGRVEAVCLFVIVPTVLISEPFFPRVPSAVIVESDGQDIQVDLEDVGVLDFQV